MAYWALARLSPLPHLASVRWLAAPQAERQSSQAAPQRYRMEAHPTAAPVGSAEVLHCRRFQWRLHSCRLHHRFPSSPASPAAPLRLHWSWVDQPASDRRLSLPAQYLDAWRSFYHLLLHRRFTAALLFSLIEPNLLFRRP